MVGCSNILFPPPGMFRGDVPSWRNERSGRSVISFPFRDYSSQSAAYSRACACAHDYNYINYKIMFLLCASFFGIATRCFTTSYKRKASFLRNEKREIYDFSTRKASFLRRNSEEFTIFGQKRVFYEKKPRFLKFLRFYTLRAAFFSHLKSGKNPSKASFLRFQNSKSEFFTIFPYLIFHFTPFHYAQKA